MANRFYSPNEQFANSAGIPYVGGQLFFYASGTSTPLTTYSDSLLTVPNPNPVVLDSAGRAGSIFLQNLAYKVVLEDANNNVIWTEDPVATSDFTATAQFSGFNGNPNGHVAGTAASAGIPASVVWDYTDAILYVCTTTGTAGTAVWTAVNATASQANTPAPQGRLTLTSGTPVLNADVISATSVFYTAYVGNLIPIFTGAQFSLQPFNADLTLSLTASQAASTLYDVFAFLNSGVLTLVTGPAWTNSTAGSCSRGTGASTTQISRLNGLWVNAVQISGKNGANTFTIPANQATFLGTIFIDSVAGQATQHIAYGQSRKIALSNAYNRKPIYLKYGDGSGGSYSSPVTLRPTNNNTANSATVLQCLPEEIVSNDYSQEWGVNSAGGATTTPSSAIGFNSTNTRSGTLGLFQITNTNASNILLQGMAYARYEAPPFLGIAVITCLEQVSSVSTATFGAGEGGSVMVSRWAA